MTAEQWEALSWDLQETYMAGLSEDPNVPFSFTGETWRPPAMGDDGPAVRENVDAGGNVFDIRAMISGLDGDPNARKRT